MSAKDLRLINGGKVEPLNMTAFQRDQHFGECALIYFDRRPTDAEMKFLHECMARSVGLMPDDLGTQQ